MDGSYSIERGSDLVILDSAAYIIRAGTSHYSNKKKCIEIKLQLHNYES